MAHPKLVERAMRVLSNCPSVKKMVGSQSCESTREKFKVLLRDHSPGGFLSERELNFIADRFAAFYQETISSLIISSFQKALSEAFCDIELQRIILSGISQSSVIEKLITKVQEIASASIDKISEDFFADKIVDLIIEAKNSDR